MLQSKLFSRTLRDIDKNETSKNAQLLIRAGFIDKTMAGVYSFLPLGFRVVKKIEAIIREEMDAIGGQELFLPAMGPKENWEKTDRWKTMDVLYKFEDDQSFTLNPTHEELITPVAKKYISSYKDLPIYLYQIQNKFRKELRAKSGILRLREFLMKDLYSFHADEKDLDEYYEKAKEAYWKIFERVGIKEKTYLTYASGGTFSKFSHEFQTIADAGEDSIFVCKKCSVAVNKEIAEDQKVCPECEGEDFDEIKAIETGNIFKLKTKFSEPFKLNYKDKNGEEKLVYMGCYGIGLNRLLGTVVEVLSDEKGMVWPETIAPFGVHLIEIGGRDEKIKAFSQKAYERLQKEGIEVLYDDREKNPGEKFAESDLIGIPWRVVVSPKTIEKDALEIKNRTSEKAEIVNIEKVIDLVKQK